MKTKRVLENTFRGLSLETAIALKMMGLMVGTIAITIEKEWSCQQSQGNGKMPTQIVFYDEIRRGNSIEKVDINLNPKLKPVD